MDGSFACPECGCEIRPTGLSPGRLVRCDWCQTHVEVPFIPRAEQILRMRHERRRSRRRWPRWAGALVVILSLSIALTGASRLVRSRWRSAETETLAKLVEASRAAEAAGRLDEAFATMEGALSLARRCRPVPAGVEELTARRDRLALKEAEARLAALESSGSDADLARSVGQALTLQARARKDPAIEPLEDQISATLLRLRTKWAEAAAVAAKAADEAGDAGAAMTLCERLYRTADELPRETRKHWQA